MIKKLTTSLPRHRHTKHIGEPGSMAVSLVTEPEGADVAVLAAEGGMSQEALEGVSVHRACHVLV